jgi:hypothetical protein
MPFDDMRVMGLSEFDSDKFLPRGDFTAMFHCLSRIWRNANHRYDGLGCYVKVFIMLS